jgi:hypothetical protein
VRVRASQPKFFTIGTGSNYILLLKQQTPKPKRDSTNIAAKAGKM